MRVLSVLLRVLLLILSLVSARLAHKALMSLLHVIRWMDALVWGIDLILLEISPLNLCMILLCTTDELTRNHDISW